MFILKFENVMSLSLVLGQLGCRSDDKATGGVKLPLVIFEGRPSLLPAKLLQITSEPLSEISAKFFTDEGGPGNVPGFLRELNGLIESINLESSSEERACESKEPVPYTLYPAGEPWDFHGQCFQYLSKGPTSLRGDFQQYGSLAETHFIYAMKQGDQYAARLTPSENGEAKLRAAYSVGRNNGPSWSSRAYGLFQFELDTATGDLEFSASGVGLGYCALHVKSIGTSLYVRYSREEKSACAEPEVLCYQDSGVSSTCPKNVGALNLTLLTREAGIANVVFDGSVHDSTAFGPFLPTSNLGGL